MRLFKQSLLFAFLCTLVIGLSSARLTSEEKKSDVPVATSESTSNVASQNSKMSYKQLKDMATTLKGEKLTLKEKIALRIFKKKIGSAMESNSAAGGKSQLVALLLVIFLGGLGIHRFYLGYTWQGIVQLLTLGGCGIWALIDLVRIITGSLKPKDGEYETTL